MSTPDTGMKKVLVRSLVTIVIVFVAAWSFNLFYEGNKTRLLKKFDTDAETNSALKPFHLEHFKAKLDCGACHEGGVQHEQPLKKTKEAVCFTCHDKIRQDQAVPANDDCKACHTKQVKRK